MPDHPTDFMPRRPVPIIQAMLETVRQYPSRVRCAVLPWTTLGALLDDVPESGRSQYPRFARGVQAA